MMWDRLGAVASRSGLTKAHPIRLATRGYLDEIEKTGKVPLTLREESPPYRTKGRIQ
jgi:hypothetical protein